jgi:hypothetical protein
MLRRADAAGAKASKRGKGARDAGADDGDEDALAVNCRLVAVGEKEVLAAVLCAIYAASEEGGEEGEGEGDGEEEEAGAEEEEGPQRRR